MTKKQLIKIISKKAAVADASARELFDLFLLRIAAELQPGESARFSNVGHFHYRKGKVKKESHDSDGNRIEYLDLIIFTTTGELDLKSANNLVFSVPDGPGGSGSNLDAHFSLSVGKPVLPNLEGSRSAAYSTDELQEILNKKVNSLMINLNKNESVLADSEILLVDIKSIDRDQLELELDDDAQLSDSQKSDDTIHSSEQLKSIAWSFGKDLSNQISSESMSDEEKKELPAEEKSESSEFGDRDWDDPDTDMEIDIEKGLNVDNLSDEPEKNNLADQEEVDVSEAAAGDENFNISEENEEIYDNIMDDLSSDLIESGFDMESMSGGVIGEEPENDIELSEVPLEENIDGSDKQIEEDIRQIDERIEEDFNISREPEEDSENLSEDELDRSFDVVDEPSDDVIDLSDKKIEESIDADKLAESLMEEEELKDLDIQMDDFEVSENDEKLGKFERVRSISSSYSELKSIKDIEGFDNFIDDKIEIGKTPGEKKDLIDDDNELNNKIEKPEPLAPDEDENPVQPTKGMKKELKLNRTESKKIRRDYDRKSSSIKFMVIFIIMAGIVGLIYIITNIGQNSGVYDEVTLPPASSDNTTFVERTYDIPVTYPYDKPKEDLQVAGLGSPDQLNDNVEETKIVETKPPVKVVKDIKEPPKLRTGQKPPGMPVQAAYSIYQYDNIFIVQVAAYRSENTAKQEVSKFLSNGRNAFIEQATIEGNKWFRVRVGNFYSLEEAKKFRTSQK